MAAVAAATAAVAVEGTAGLAAAGVGAFGPLRQPPQQQNDECELDFEGPTKPTTFEYQQQQRWRRRRRQ